MRYSNALIVAGVLLGSTLGGPVRAQEADTSASGAAIRPLVTVGRLAEDRFRLEQVLGRAPLDGFLIRSTSTLTAPLASRGGGFGWDVVAPEVRTTWNSEIPLSLNDGAMWAGRGATVLVSAGVRAALGPVDLTLAPQLSYAQNRGFQITPSDSGGRSAFAYPWGVDTQSIDMPIRFGYRPFVLIDPGQSTLSVSAGGVTAGASTENQWWGPGIRTALLLSNNAPGIPHLFARTTTPVETPIGSWEGKWIAGALVESLYFDSIAANDLRSISAFALTYRPTWERDLTLGVARAVYSGADGRGDVLAGAADALIHWEGAPPADTLATSREQILSLFGRWVFPSDGFELYAEWARVRLPGSVRDFLTAPNHTQGYTVGFQWAEPRGKSLVRLQGELSYLEKSSTLKQRPVNTFYASRGVPQGYTHRGQVVGAAIGPGSSSQWFAGDYLAPAWQAGLFLGRVRWHSDFLYDTPSPAPGRQIRTASAFDVSVLAGPRVARAVGPYWIGADFTVERRLNYLFQNPDLDFTSPGVNVLNQSLRLFLEARH